MVLAEVVSRIEGYRKAVKQFDDLVLSLGGLDSKPHATQKRGRKAKTTNEKRGPGRPRKVEATNPMPRKVEATDSTVKRGPGRPRKVEAATTKPRREKETKVSAEKRGPGRPKGSPNKPKSDGSDKMTWKKVIRDRLLASPTNLDGLIEAAIKGGFNPTDYKDGVKGMTQNIRTTLNKMQNDKEVEKSEDKNYSLTASAAA